MKRIIIIFVSVSIILVLITAFLIFYKLQLSTNKPSESENISKVLYEEYHLPINDDTKGADFNQRISTNGIKFFKYSYEDDKLVGEYYQIDGLKDKAIQESINSKLKSKLIEVGTDFYNKVKYFDSISTDLSQDPEAQKYSLKKYIDGEEIFYFEDKYKTDDFKIFVSEAVLSSFSNVISIMVSPFEQFYPYYSGYDFLNINLINGEELKIEEIFTSDVKSAEMFSKGLYKNLGSGEIFYDNYDTYVDEVTGEKFTYGYGNGYYENVDTNLLQKIVRKFKYTKDIKFGFTDSYLLINFNDYKVVIQLKDYMQHVAIFNRYSNQDIYDGKYEIFNNIPAFNEFTKGDIVKYAVFNKNIGKVNLNYLISYKGSSLQEKSNTSYINDAINQINDMVSYDVDKINELYSGDNRVLYTSAFRINILEVGMPYDYDKEIEQYLNVGEKLLKIDYSPNVYEISSEDLDYFQSNICKSINTYAGEYFDVNNSYYYYGDSENLVEEIVFNTKKLACYYENIRKDFYRKEDNSYDDQEIIYYDNIYNQYQYIKDNYRVVNNDDLFNIVVKKDKIDDIAQIVYNKAMDYKKESMSMQNYEYQFRWNQLQFRFPYYDTKFNYMNDYEYNITVFKNDYFEDRNPYLCANMGI